MNQSETLERRILWFDEDEPAPPPPSPASSVDGLIPTGIGIWGALQARPGPGDDLRIPAIRPTYSFDPAITPNVAPPSPTPYSGPAPALDSLIPVGIGIWGSLQSRPQPGDALR